MIAWEDFEVFNPKFKKTSCPVVSVSSKYSFVFNKSCEDLIGENSFLVLQYSKKNNLIIFDFTSAAGEHGLVLSKGSNFQVSATPFFRYFRLEHLKGKKFQLIEMIIGKFKKRWVIDLNQNFKGEL